MTIQTGDKFINLIKEHGKKHDNSYREHTSWTLGNIYYVEREKPEGLEKAFYYVDDPNDIFELIYVIR